MSRALPEKNLIHALYSVVTRLGRVTKYIVPYWPVSGYCSIFQKKKKQQLCLFVVVVVFFVFFLGGGG